MAFIDNIFDENFLEYASYVIKDRAIPHIKDGFKPVQRRILHTLFELDDGKFHKVANVVGSAMRFHPHGDASIYEALVVLANKNLFIDRQGNFGNIYTGDSASAARYIECRLLKLAKEVLFNPDLTEYDPSYDGRNKEPITLPAKIPVLLMQGAEGIAVGMATKILPHNFCELLQAQIACLKGESFTVYPDFATAGYIDVSEYNDGRGKVMIRAKIDDSDPKKLVIREIPFGTTTESLISSIEEAARKNQIKISGISDYTAEHVEIEIRLPRGIYTNEVIESLYAFTDCQVSASSNINVIRNDGPVAMTVTEVITYNTEQLLNILKRELEIEAAKLHDKMHAKTLEQIFIENRIYRQIEEVKASADAVVQAIRNGLIPFVKKIKREVTDDDINRLKIIPIHRISLYDINRAKNEMRDILLRLKEIKHHLDHLSDYATAFLEALLENYGHLYPRKSQLSEIDRVDVRQAARRDLKLSYDRLKGYLGLKVSGDLIAEVSPYDRIMIIDRKGIFKVVDVPEKLFVDLKILYCGLIDKDKVFNLLYRESGKGMAFIKRFKLDRFILNREYHLLPEDAIYPKLEMASNRTIILTYKPKPRQKINEEQFPIENFPIRNFKAKGLRLSAREVKNLNSINNG